MFLKQLHDQGPALVQSSTQRRAGDPVQIPEKILSFCTGLNKECIGITFNTPFGAVLQLLRLMLPVVPALSKVKMSPSLLGVLGSELQLERRRVFLLGELGSSAVTSNSGHMTHQG